MAITIRDDDAGSRPTVIVIRDDDHREIILSSLLPVSAGGTGSDLSNTGPGLVQQPTNGGNLSILPLASGEIVQGDNNGVPAVITPNNTTERKFLVEKTFFANQPLAFWDRLHASDIFDGVLSVDIGGLGATFALNSGVPYQPTPGAAMIALPYSPWATFTPVRDAQTGDWTGGTVLLARWRRFGGSIFVKVLVVDSNVTAGTSFLSITIPESLQASSSHRSVALAALSDNGTLATGFVQITSTQILIFRSMDGSVNFATATGTTDVGFEIEIELA